MPTQQPVKQTEKQPMPCEQGIIELSDGEYFLRI